MPGTFSRGGFIGTLAETISRGVGENVGVTRRGLKKVGLSGAVAPGTSRTRVIGPRAGNSNTANLVTGRGSGRRFISNDQYSAIHQMRGRKIIGGGMVAGSMGVVNADAGKKGYYNPVPTPKGSGRFA
jgi:hypothetical protein